MSRAAQEAPGLRPHASNLRLRKNQWRVLEALRKLLPDDVGTLAVSDVVEESGRETGVVVRAMMRLTDHGVIERSRTRSDGLLDVALR